MGGGIYVCDMGSIPSRANPIKVGGLGAASRCLGCGWEQGGATAPAIVLITFQICDEENSPGLMNEPRGSLVTPNLLIAKIRQIAIMCQWRCVL